MSSKYPDMTEIWKTKERRRVEVGNWPIEKKLKEATKLRDAVKLIKTAIRLDNGKSIR